MKRLQRLLLLATRRLGVWTRSRVYLCKQIEDQDLTMKTWLKRHSETKGLCAQLAQTHGGQLRGLRSSLLLRPPTDMRLGPSANCGYLDMLGLRKSHPGQMPKPKRLDPAGLSRSQVHTDGLQTSENAKFCALSSRFKPFSMRITPWWFSFQ
ncbi:hypothetical protein GH733_015354 [Mirounga leonina]|nr:hypothetical protein GH733_015354 [Mirounga leonina]